MMGGGDIAGTMVWTWAGSFMDSGGATGEFTATEMLDEMAGVSVTGIGAAAATPDVTGALEVDPIAAATGANDGDKGATNFDFGALSIFSLKYCFGENFGS